MNQRWVIEEDLDPAKSLELTRSLGCPPIIAQLLVRRGINSVDRARKFFQPSLKDLCDPFILADMEEGVARVVKALERQEHIMIFGDYDVDGITSTALLYLVLSRLGAPVSYYLPNRITEGYGLSEEGLQIAKDRGCTLIVSVDCGVTAVKEVARATELGIDIIVTDHHEPADQMPKAVAIINPKLNPLGYPGGDLSGVGVAYKFAQGLYEYMGIDQFELETHLDLVTLGTAADIVPLLNENRVLVKFGLQQLVRSEKVGLKALLEVAGLIGREIGTGQVVFIMAPRINAVGRMGDADKAIRLLTTNSAPQAMNIALALDDANRRRKEFDEAIFREARGIIENELNLEEEFGIILASDKWHPGVIGIVASRIVERYNRPTVLISIQNGEGKGSARSIPGFHILNAIKACEPYLIKFGGHKYAAGLTIAPDQIENFRKHFNLVASAMLSQSDLVPTIMADSFLSFDQIDLDLNNWIKQFAPYGPGNMRPVFVTRNVEIVGRPSTVGKNSHLKFKARNGGKVYDVIGFNMGDQMRLLQVSSEPISLCYVIEENNYEGYPKIQLRLRDIHVGELL